MHKKCLVIVAICVLIKFINGDRNYNDKYNDIVKGSSSTANGDGNLKTAIERELPKSAKFFDDFNSK